MKSSSKAIAGFSVENILQMSSMEGKSHVLTVLGLEGVGYLYIEKGELIDAVVGEISGEEAAIEILCWESSSIEIDEYQQRPKTINMPLMKLLLKAAKLRDDRLSEDHSAGIDLLERAIELAEAHRYKPAHQEIVKFLKNNKRNARGLIWFSRIHGNIDIMERAIVAACALSPHDTFVIKEQEKFAIAKRKLDGGKVRKCYFCWIPVNKNAERCHHCLSFLTISEKALQLTGHPNPALFVNAIKRYSRVNQKFPDSLTAHYCLSLSHLNMGNFKEALHSLGTLTRKAPEKEAFTLQFNLLLEHLASTGMQK